MTTVTVNGESQDLEGPTTVADLVALVEPPFGLEQPDHLGDEERVALGLAVDRGR